MENHRSQLSRPVQRKAEVYARENTEAGHLLSHALRAPHRYERALSLRQPPARLLAMIYLSIAVRGRALIVSPW